jgi:hypothetical protein
VKSEADRVWRAGWNGVSSPYADVLGFTEGRPANTYRGWQAIAEHQRIRHAVEVDRSMGMALLN